MKSVKLKLNLICKTTLVYINIWEDLNANGRKWQRRSAVIQRRHKQQINVSFITETIHLGRCR